MHNNAQLFEAMDLRERAERAAREAGFETQFPAAALAEAARLDEAESPINHAVRDLRHLLWSSIDNEESRDLDQVEWCERLENEDIRLCVGVADVAAYVPLSSAIDRHAAGNTVSIYTGVQTFPLLPERLSTDITSLLPGQERGVIVVDMTVGADGIVTRSEIYRAQVKNAAKLVYEVIGDWLEGQSAAPREVVQVPNLEAQIRLQWEVAMRLHKRRQSQGALDVEQVEARPIVVNGRVTGLATQRKNPARVIIENFMVTTNTVLAGWLESHGCAAIQRIVREPQRWPRIVQLAREKNAILPDYPDARALSQFLTAQRALAPERFADLSLAILKLLGRGEYVVVHGAQDSVGHFGLGMQNYAHSTAPNRRFPDLVTQRIVQSQLDGAPAPYGTEELAAIAAHCSEREAAAQKVERLMRKIAAAALLQDRIGDVFEAVVTGASRKGTYVRTKTPLVEGRVMRGERGLDVGDRVRVRLLRTDLEQGHIDFERI